MLQGRDLLVATPLPKSLPLDLRPFLRQFLISPLAGKHGCARAMMWVGALVLCIRAKHWLRVAKTLHCICRAGWEVQSHEASNWSASPAER